MTTPQAIEELSYSEYLELAKAVWGRILPITNDMSAHEIRDREKFLNEREGDFVYSLKRLPSWALDRVATLHGVGVQRETTTALGAPPSMLLAEAEATA